MRDIECEVWKNSTEKFRHTKKGLLTNLYQKLKFRNKQKCFGNLSFDLNQFKDWSFNDNNFHRLFDIWEFDNYNKKSKPSVDRINANEGYVFNNMQWLSWNENYYKGISEVAKKKEVPVLIYKNGVYLGKFKSIKDAQYFLGLKSNGNISAVLNGNREYVHGYHFEYENSDLLGVSE